MCTVLEYCVVCDQSVEEIQGNEWRYWDCGIIYWAFQSVVIACQLISRLRKMHICARLMITYTEMKNEPYLNRNLRKLIDTIAFDIYSHWVKKGEEQNRAAVFQTSPKRDRVGHENMHVDTMDYMTDIKVAS